MSQSDKTRQKLVDSMRKTKSGATGKSGSSAESTNKAETQTQKKDTSAVKAKPAPKRSEKKTAIKNETDGYQSARRRVWPD